MNAWSVDACGGVGEDLWPELFDEISTWNYALRNCALGTNELPLQNYHEGKGDQAMDLITGTWEDRIYDPDGAVVKSDIITLRQVGEEIAGSIRREYPPEQAHRKWEISGKLVGKDFIAIFWSNNPEITSHGCWHLRRENDALFTGYYMKTDAGDLPGAKPVRLELERKS